MKHRKKDISLRILSLFFAITMVLSCGKNIVFTSATAAPSRPNDPLADKYLYFGAEKWRAKTDILEMVEGKPVTLEAYLPEGYALKASQPFTITPESGTLTPEEQRKKIEIGSGSTVNGVTRYSAKTQPGSAGENGVAEYVLTPNFQQTGKKEGTVNIGSKGGLVTITQGSLGIIAESTMKWKVTDIKPGNKEIQLGELITGATGSCIDFNNYRPQVLSQENKGQQLILEVGLRDNKFKLEINLGDYEIQKGNEFVITFYPPRKDQLILTIKSEDVIRREVFNDIINGSTAIKPDDTMKNYIDLRGDDFLTAIKEPFDLLTKVRKANLNDDELVEISWKWVPDDKFKDKPGADKVVEIPPATGRYLTVTLNRFKEDVSGKLIPTITLNGKKYDNVDNKGVNIVIVGSGNVPRIEYVSETRGTKGAEIITNSDGSVKKEIETDISKNTFPPRTMDVYRGGKLPHYEGGPIHPFKYKAKLYLGKGLGRAESVIIRAVKPTPQTGEIEIIIDGDTSHPYNLGDKIENKYETEAAITVEYYAKTKGTQDLQLEYIFINGGKERKYIDTVPNHFLTIRDTKPREYKDLDSVEFMSQALKDNVSAHEKYPNGKIDIGFKPEQYNYPDIVVPYSVERIKVFPRVNVNKGIDKIIKYTIGASQTDPYDTTDKTQTAKGIDVPLPADPVLQVGLKTTLELEVKAEDGSTARYIFDITRDKASNDTTLKSLSITDSYDSKKEFITKENFTPADDTKRVVEIEVPFSTRDINIKAISNHLFVQKAEIYSIGADGTKTLIANGVDPTKSTVTAQKIKLKHPLDIDSDYTGSEINKFAITIKSEEGSEKDYILNIKRLPPDKNAFLSKLEVADIEDTVFPFFGDVKFDKEAYFYTVHIPYSLDALKLNFKTESIVAKNVHIELINKDGQIIQNTSQNITENLMEEQSVLVKCPKDDENFMGQFKATLVILPESGLEEDRKTYEIRFMRNDPDKENKLKSLKILDKNGKEIPQLSFNPETTEYGFTVDYGDTDILYIEPEALSPLATVRVQVGRDLPVTITKANKNEMMKLNPNESKIVAITVKPEDPKAPSKTYKLTIRRNTPSKECRLELLKVDGGEGFSPKFNPNMVSYKVNIPEGKDSITFTAKPIHPKATMSINKKNLVAEKASEPYKPFDAYTIVNIVVTAEDGKTQKTYKINVRNENLAPKSGNADLRSLVVNYGTMEPKFNPSITEYRVSVSDETTSVNIIPTPAVASSKITVYMNSKKLGDYYDNYSTALEDGENEITITVTSEDEKYKKVYTVLVYSKDEENQGHNKPITSEMVNFDAPNPIVVDITKYTRISADVFNKLKKDYPEKTIIFEGNDYSLRIKGSDITDSTIPYETVYDLGLSFKSPNEDKIYDFINRDNRNASVEPIIIHFMHHGTLPGPMLFTISLGRQYKDMKGTWYYYNEERDRMDLYGEVGTNSRGTFSAKLNHMSTYVLSKRYIVGSENKTNTTGIMGSGKPNPNTGYAESYTAPTEYLAFTKRIDEYIDEDTDIE